MIFLKDFNNEPYCIASCYNGLLIGGGGLQGQATEIKIHADHMIKTREKLNRILSDRTGQTLETIMKDTERDNYMTAEQALEYGLIDAILDKRN